VKAWRSSSPTSAESTRVSYAESKHEHAVRMRRKWARRAAMWARHPVQIPPPRITETEFLERLSSAEQVEREDSRDEQ
jgi:hypothetical protein